MLIGLKRLRPRRYRFLFLAKRRKKFSKGQWFFSGIFIGSTQELKRNSGWVIVKTWYFLYVFMVFDFACAEGDWMIGLSYYELDWRLIKVWNSQIQLKRKLWWCKWMVRRESRNISDPKRRLCLFLLEDVVSHSVEATSLSTFCSLKRFLKVFFVQRRMMFSFFESSF